MKCFQIISFVLHWFRYFQWFSIACPPHVLCNYATFRLNWIQKWRMCANRCMLESISSVQWEAEIRERDAVEQMKSERKLMDHYCSIFRAFAIRMSNSLKTAFLHFLCVRMRTVNRACHLFELNSKLIRYYCTFLIPLQFVRMLFHCCRIKIWMYVVRHCHRKPLYPQRLNHTVNSLMLSYNGYRNGYPINRMTFDILDVTQ